VLVKDGKDVLENLCKPRLNLLAVTLDHQHLGLIFCRRSEQCVALGGHTSESTEDKDQKNLNRESDWPKDTQGGSAARVGVVSFW